MRTLLATLALSAASLLAIAHCQPKDRGFSEGTGGSGGGTNDAGADGGDGGPSTVGQDCTDDTDCSDEIACNGIEVCEDNVCAAGPDPCAELAEEGCVVGCSEDGGETVCEKGVEDADEDGHVAIGNTCSVEHELPIDDCDDDNPDAYSGAEEVCDGADNDCDGLNDFSEGFALAGSFQTLFDFTGAGEASSSYSAAAWSEAHQRWGVVWGTDVRLWFAMLTPAGDLIDTPTPLIDDGVNHNSYVGLAFAGDLIGVMWGSQPAATWTYQFARFELTGEDLTPSQLDVVPVPVAGGMNSATLAYAEGGGWALMSTNNGDATVHRFSNTGALVPPVLTLDDSDWINHIVQVGDQVVGVWKFTEYDEEDVWLGGGFRWASWGGNNMAERTPPAPVLPVSTEITGGTARVAALEDGAFFMVRPRSGDVTVLRHSFDGSNDCGPVEMTGSGLPLGVDGEIYATGNQHSAFYLARPDEGGPLVSPLPLDCDVNSVFMGQSAAEFIPEYPCWACTTVASGSAGHLIVIPVVVEAALHLQARAFGNAYCDTPVAQD